LRACSKGHRFRAPAAGCRPPCSSGDHAGAQDWHGPLDQRGQSEGEKVLMEMRHGIEAGATSLTVTTRIGIAYACAPADAEALLATADKALHAAKGNRKETSTG
jgi:GGDEF domain-containing protein